MESGRSQATSAIKEWARLTTWMTEASTRGGGIALPPPLTNTLPSPQAARRISLSTDQNTSVPSIFRIYSPNPSAFKQQHPRLSLWPRYPPTSSRPPCLSPGKSRTIPSLLVHSHFQTSLKLFPLFLSLPVSSSFIFKKSARKSPVPGHFPSMCCTRMPLHTHLMPTGTSPLC